MPTRSPADKPPRPSRPRISVHDVLLLGIPNGKTELLDGRVPRVLISASDSEAQRVFQGLARELIAMHPAGKRCRVGAAEPGLAMGRYHLRVEGRAVWLYVRVSRALWDEFCRY